MAEVWLNSLVSPLFWLQGTVGQGDDDEEVDSMGVEFIERALANPGDWEWEERSHLL